jgi:NIMA (never in mitosis gene a)-related kinase
MVLAPIIVLIYHKVTEYAKKGDLGNVVEKAQKSRKFLREDEIWSYFIQMCNGLQALHSAGILHRDLKPKNIFLSDSNQLLIGDLGCSKVVKAGMARTQVGKEM